MAKPNQKTKDEEIIELTQDTFNELKEELENRKTKIREQIADEIASARDLGDLSENHPYKVAMEKKEMNENRIVDLDSMLKNAKVVSSTGSSKVITIGKSVEIKNKATGSKRVVKLGGSEVTESADPEEGVVSVDSPIGKAIFKAKIGETVTVELPTRSVEFEIIKFV